MKTLFDQYLPQITSMLSKIPDGRGMPGYVSPNFISSNSGSPDQSRHKNAPQGAKLVQDYVTGSVVNPISQGIQDVQKPDIMNKASGAGQIVGGAFSATPEGALVNAGRGIAVGAMKSARTGAQLDPSIREAVTQPSDIGGTGLGLPAIPATMVDVATGNPKAGIKNLKSVGSALKGYSPRAFNIHPEDQKIMSDFVNAIQTGAAKQDLGQLGKDAQLLGEYYIGKSAIGVTNEKLAKAFDALLASHARHQGQDALQTPFPKMGITAGTPKPVTALPPITRPGLAGQGGGSPVKINSGNRSDSIQAMLSSVNGSSDGASPAQASTNGGDPNIDSMLQGVNIQPDRNIESASVSKAKHYLGSQAFNGLCQTFVERMSGSGTMGRTAAEAWNNQLDHAAVGLSGARPGDKVYFGPDSSNGGAGHVGLYLGGGKMISARYDGVKIDDVNHWSKQTGQKLLGHVSN